MTPIDILPKYAIKKFNSPATLTDEEREAVFKISLPLKQYLNKIKASFNKAGFLLQYGYYIQNNRFFTSDKFYKKDIEFVFKKLSLPFQKDFCLKYTDRVRQQHRLMILDILGHKSALEAEDEIARVITQMAEKQAHPRKILAVTVEILINKKIEIPSYNFFAKIISKEFLLFENNLLNQIDKNITEEQKEVLDGLLSTIEGDYQRPLVTRLKHINQSIRPSKIKHGLRNFLIIKKLFLETESMRVAVDLSNEATKYYAQWIIKAQSYQAVQIKNENRRYLYLLAFIDYYFKIWQDVLVDVLLKCVQQQLNKMEKINTDTVTENLPERNKLTISVITGLHAANIKIENIKKVLYCETMDNDMKVYTLHKILPKSVEDKQKSEQVSEAAKTLKEQIRKEKYDIPKMNILTMLSRKLQNRVGDLVKYLSFSDKHQNEELMAAVSHYQTALTINSSAPSEFLSDVEYEMIYDAGKFNVSLYKAILFCKLANAIKSGEISLDNSFRYLTLDSYLIDMKEWEANKSTLLEELGLKKFGDIKQVIKDLKNLDTKFFEVNNRILNKSNSYAKPTKDNKVVIYTPPLVKPDYESIAEIIGKDKYIPVIQIMSEINEIIGFTTHFKHYKIKQSKQPPDDIVFLAGVFAIASRMGLHKLANTSLGINYNKLTNCVAWYFSLENLHTLNEELTKCMKKLALPNKFKKDQQSLHSSGDCQKVCVSAESLNADCSYKYHGNGKGINICRFIDERGILFYTTAFSSTERDATYVIDGLYNNKEIHSDIHSTDTLGYTELIFAISHLFGVKFAPRIKDVMSQNLVSFGKIKKDLNGIEAPIIPMYYVKEEKFIDQWDSVLRLIATIKRGDHKASVILKRLGSYSKENPLKSALKEFGRIIKSQFILEYIDDVDLRQSIEKQLNKGELANKFASAVSFASDSISQSYPEDQEIFAMCQTIVQNIIILWNYLELTKIIMRSDGKIRKTLVENITSASILTWQHVNMHGTYDFTNLTSDNDNEFDYEEILNFKIA